MQISTGQRVFNVWPLHFDDSKSFNKHVTGGFGNKHKAIVRISKSEGVHLCRSHCL